MKLLVEGGMLVALITGASSAPAQTTGPAPEQMRWGSKSARSAT
jgi:hypothetical protein